MDESAARRLLYAMEHPPVYHAGVSERALRMIQSVVGGLATAGSETFEPPSRYNKGGDKNARKHIRFLTALVPREVPAEQIPVVIADIISNPCLTPAAVLDILTGSRAGNNGHYTSPDAMREAGAMLREGWPREDIVTATGVRKDLVAELGVFLGVVQARDEYLRDMAAEWLDEGRDDPAAFAEVYRFPKRNGPGDGGSLVQLSDVEQAKALFEDVREALADAG